MSIPHPTQTQLSSGCRQEITESVVALVSSSDPTFPRARVGSGDETTVVCVCVREIVTASEF